MDSENSPTLRSRLLTGLAGLLALLMLYLAAFGPFCYLYARTGIESERLLALYFPLRAAADRHPVTRRWFFAYANRCFELGTLQREKNHGIPDVPMETPVR